MSWLAVFVSLMAAAGEEATSSASALELRITAGVMVVLFGVVAWFAKDRIGTADAALKEMGIRLAALELKVADHVAGCPKSGEFQAALRDVESKIETMTSSLRADFRSDIGALRTELVRLIETIRK